VLAAASRKPHNRYFQDLPDDVISDDTRCQQALQRRHLAIPLDRDRPEGTGTLDAAEPSGRARITELWLAGRGVPRDERASYQAVVEELWTGEPPQVTEQAPRMVADGMSRAAILDKLATLLVVENEQELADEITAKLRALRPSEPVSIDTARAQVLDVLRPYIDDLTWRKERGARRAAADITTAVLLGLHECRDDSDENMLLVRMGLPGAADDLARAVYEKVKRLHLTLPGLADECPEWAWYEESWP